MHKFGALVECFFTVSLVLAETKLSQKGGALIPVETVYMVLHISFLSNCNCGKNEILANWQLTFFTVYFLSGYVQWNMQLLHY